MIQPTLIIHGGAGKSIALQSRLQSVRQKIKKIVSLAYQRLQDSRALDAAVYAVTLLENDPEFNAGTGSMLQSDGKARLSASVMDGTLLRFAGVINIENIKNPVLVAKALLEKKDRVLACDGAVRFARSLGFKSYDPRTPAAIKRWKKALEIKSDTVGACALDRHGNLASATSTGGRGLEFPGRVSDSGMPAATYADIFCAISATGTGEEIMDQGLAVRIAAYVESGLSISEAFKRAFKIVHSRGHRMGAIGLDRKGRIHQATSTESLIYGWQKGRSQKIF